MNKEIDLAGIHLECPVMNAAGTCRTKEEAEILARSAISMVVIGSYTIEERKGNEGETFWVGSINNRFPDIFSLNSRGLPNAGIKNCGQVLPEIAKIVRQAGKILCVSVAGFSPQEYALLAKFAFEKGADAVELDLSCPNCPDVCQIGAQKRIICFDSLLVKEILKTVEETVGSGAKILVKLSPFSDPFALKETAEVIGHQKAVKAVVSMNTFPNALAFDEKGRSKITVGKGLAGLGGPAIKPIALGQVRQLRDFLPKHVDVVGVGGIFSGTDVSDFQLAGAKAVQLGTFLLKLEPKAWPEKINAILIEYYEQLRERT